MLLNVGGMEIEIREEAFVCIDQSEASCFCEWEQLTPELQQAFKEFRKEVIRKVQELLASDQGSTFLSLAEQYRRTLRFEGCPGSD